MNAKHDIKKIISIILVVAMIFTSMVSIGVNTYADDTYVDVTIDTSSTENDAENPILQVMETDRSKEVESTVENVDDVTEEDNQDEALTEENTVNELDENENKSEENSEEVNEEENKQEVDETELNDETQQSTEEDENKEEVVEENQSTEDDTTQEATEPTDENEQPTTTQSGEEVNPTESTEPTTEEELTQPSEEPIVETVEEIDLSPYEDLDFSSMRLLVAGVDGELIKDMPVIAEYDGMYMMQFDSTHEAKVAYAKLDGKASFLVIDTTFVLNEGESEGQSNPMDENNNAFTNLENELNTTTSIVYDIAIIDSGSNNPGVTKVSMLGDDGSDDNGHGTSMIGAMLGQNPSAKVLSIKAFSNSGTADASTIYAAIEYAMQSNVRIINMSFNAFQTADNSFVKNKIEEALNSGIIIIASAGNYNTDAKYFIPANIPGVITIGALNEDLTKNNTSNMGSVVDYYVVAPSTSVAAARFTGAYSIDNTVPDFARTMYSDEPVINPDPDPTTDDFILDSFCTSAFIIGVLNTNQLGSGLGNMGAVSVKLTNDMIQTITTPMIGQNSYARTYTFEYIVIDGAIITDDHTGSNGAATGINFSNCSGNFADFAKLGAYASRECGGNTFGNYDQSGGEHLLANSNTWFNNTFGGKVIITAATGVGGHTSLTFARDGSGNLVQGQPVLVYSFHSDAWNRQNSTANAVLSFENSTNDLYMYVEKSAPSGFSAQGATFGVYASEADANADRNRLTTLTIGTNGKSSSYKHTSAESSVTLYVKELTTPTQSGDFTWIKDSSVKPITLTTSNTSSNPGTVSFTNNVQQYGYIQVKKTVPTGYSAQGATFGVYGSQADANANTNRLATLTIGSNGVSEKYKVTLPVGINQSKTIYVKELTAPTQSGNFTWNIDTSVKNYTITASHTSSSPYTFNVTNTVQAYGYAYVHKDVPNGFSPAGAEYTIYTDAACNNAAGASIFASGNVEKFTIGSNGDSNVIKFKVTTGSALTLYVKETKVPSASSQYYTWSKDTNIYSLKVNVGNTSSNAVRIGSSDDIVVPATVNKSVDKVRAKYLAVGAQFTMYYAGTNTIVKDINGNNCIFTVTQDANGNLVTETYTIKLNNASSGDKVVLKETHVPAGFSKAPDYSFTLTAFSSNTMNITNHYLTESVFIQKSTNRPELLSLYPITGTKYGIYVDQSCRTLAKDINTGKDCILECAVNGKTQTYELPLGTYYVKEISTTEWYELDQTVLKLVLDQDGATYKLEHENILKPGKGKVEKGFKNP